MNKSENVDVLLILLDFEGVLFGSDFTFLMMVPARYIPSGPLWVNHAYCIILLTESTYKDVLNLFTVLSVTLRWRPVISGWRHSPQINQV